MSVDRLSNMLSMLKNASMVRKVDVEVPYSRTCEDVAKVLKEHGFLDEVKKFKHKDSKFQGLNLKIALDSNGASKITDAKRVSKPGRRIYRAANEFGKFMSGKGVSVVSTNRGVISGEEARKRNLGGEVICQVW